MEILISVVVPTYNRPKLLQTCLFHLTNQNFGKRSYEIIIVSDGPDEKTKAVVARYIACGVTNLRFFSLPSRKGPAAARNLGWRSARGRLIAFTDDDCRPDVNWLATLHAADTKGTEIAFTGKVVVPVSEQPTDFELNTKGLERGTFVTANCAVSKSALEAVGGFDEEFATAWREDSDLEFKLRKAAVPIKKAEDAIVLHPVREAPWGISIKEQKKSMYNALLFKKYPKLYRQYIKPKPTFRYYFIILFFLLGIVSIIGLNMEAAIVSFAAWFILTAGFTQDRLKTTRKTKDHVLEMIATSAVIPFLSVYWTLYGAVKYKVLFF